MRIWGMAQYHCNYCQENIYGLRVKCAECTDFDLCLRCFCCGAEIGCHKSDHQYQIIDCGNFPVYDAPHDDWRANEELRLLDAVEQYGFGNWDDIANQIQTKSCDEAKDHYSALYIRGTVGRATWPHQVSCKPKDHTSPESGPLSPGSSARPQVFDLTPQEQQELGYMPNRDDFEREYDNEAELVASNLTVSQDDEEIDVALKLAHVDMFSWRLRERLRRKRIARDYNLVSHFYSKAGKTTKGGTNSKKKHSKEDKELQERMKVLSQFHTCQEQEQLFENIQKEKELKSRVKELVRYRRNGLTKSDDCSEFDSARYKREKKKENKKKSGSSGTTHHRKSSTASRKQEERGNSATTIDEQSADATADEAISTTPVTAVTVMASSSTSSTPASSLGSVAIGSAAVAVAAVSSASKDVDETHDELPPDMEVLAGHEMLSCREKKLCGTLGLKPAAYLTLKTVLLKDHLLRRQGIPVKSHHHPSGLDKVRRRRILGFMVSSGWLTTS